MIGQGSRAQIIGCLRGAVGLGLFAAPRLVIGWQAGEPPTATSVLLLRTIGVRDLALGVGTAIAAQSTNGREVQRWVAAGLFSDALDILAAASASRTMGGHARTAVLAPVPFLLGDLWALRRSAA